MENIQPHNEENVRDGEQTAPYSLAELEYKWKRAVADFANYKKDEAKQLQAFHRFAKTEMVRQLLPFFDAFERALKEIPSGIIDTAWAGGLGHTREEFLSVLNKNGFRRIETRDQEFDPKYHEAVGRADADGEDIIEEIRSGFIAEDDLVVRPAQVKIGKNNLKS